MTSDDIDVALEAWRQGDFVLGEHWFVYRSVVDDSGTDLVEDPIPGFAVLTQTCDIVRPHGQRPFVEVAPLEAATPADIKEIVSGRRPARAALRALSALDFVVDLDRVMTIDKALLVSHPRHDGASDDGERRAFSAALARKRERFAFPDDFVARARGLQRRVQSKHDRLSAEGEALRSLREIRVDARPSWSATDVELTFWFISPGPITQPHAPSLLEWVESWLSRFEEGGRFRRVGGRWVSLDEMTAREYVDSVPLDLDHLSTRGG